MRFLGILVVKFKIVSGGQTGVDQGGLEAAISLGLPYGGWIPNWREVFDTLRQFLNWREVRDTPRQFGG